MTIRNTVCAAIAVALVVGSVQLSRSAAQYQNEDRKTQSERTGRGGPFDGFPDLVGGLKATKGCLGVETAGTSSGKNVIFAWFEDKKAVEQWYYSEMHQGAMKQFFPHGGYNKPLREVADDSGPIMAIASITMSNKAEFEQSKLPISQIAIELYQPITGGIYLGSRFAPDAVKVRGLKDVATMDGEK